MSSTAGSLVTTADRRGAGTIIALRIGCERRSVLRGVFFAFLGLLLFFWQ